MAEKLEDYKMLIFALSDFNADVVAQALRVLNTDQMYRSEKVGGVASWLYQLHVDRNATKLAKRKNNITWRAVATVPAGFCHIRSSMIGTLLEDIVAGLSFDDISRRFADKMNPTKYQRPQAAPAAGNIKVAEEIVAKLGIVNSLRRRFARLEELQTLWLPKTVAASTDKEQPGVFGHLKTKGAKPSTAVIELPSQTMTWAKFCAKVLPTAEKIDAYVKREKMNFCAIVTAADFDAPPIIQWDREACRNPFSSFVYNNGSMHTQWGVESGWNEVTGIVRHPEKWVAVPQAQNVDGVILVIKGCVDSRDSGLALFPEILKSDLREIRSTIEAYSNAGTLEGRDQASACGLALREGAFAQRLRVKDALGVTEFIINSWD